LMFAAAMPDGRQRAGGNVDRAVLAGLRRRAVNLLTAVEAPWRGRDGDPASCFLSGGASLRRAHRSLARLPLKKTDGTLSAHYAIVNDASFL
jgi:hypothetical protein